ncbi:MAG: hypothetical protein U5N86_12115 [Planctomycetota bacterium]|nr:hypothetical protein [Planctomycetota bacterium]
MILISCFLNRRLLCRCGRHTPDLSDIGSEIAANPPASFVTHPQEGERDAKTLVERVMKTAYDSETLLVLTVEKDASREERMAAAREVEQFILPLIEQAYSIDGCSPLLTGPNMPSRADRETFMRMSQLGGILYAYGKGEGSSTMAARALVKLSRHLQPTAYPAMVDLRCRFVEYAITLAPSVELKDNREQYSAALDRLYGAICTCAKFREYTELEQLLQEKDFFSDLFSFGRPTFERIKYDSLKENCKRVNTFRQELRSGTELPDAPILTIRDHVVSDLSARALDCYEEFSKALTRTESLP